MGLISYTLDEKPRHQFEMRDILHHDTADDRLIVEHTQDIEPIIQSNKEKQNSGDGYTQDRSMRLVARIPLVIVEKIIKEKGWNPMLEENRDRLLALLDDPEYRYLRTSEGRLSRRPVRTYHKASTATIRPVYAGDE